MAENEVALSDKLSKWKFAMESKGMKVNTVKTKVMWMDTQCEEESVENFHVQCVRMALEEI